MIDKVIENISPNFKAAQQVVCVSFPGKTPCLGMDVDDIHGPSPRIVHQLIYAFIGISSLEDNPPTPFILGASHLPSLISYNQWREAHLGEQHALLYLDSYAAFKAYMGYPLMDVHPQSLENYFVNISELLES